MSRFRRGFCETCGKEFCGHKPLTNGERWFRDGLCPVCGGGKFPKKKCELLGKTCLPPSRPGSKGRSASSETVSKRLGSELQKLSALFNGGALTQEEFNKAKKKLIGE